MSVRFGRYFIEERVALGGMAEIFRGYSTSGRTVAIKKILPAYASQEKFTQMFLDEAKIVAHLRHRNIVAQYDFGRIEDTYFLALEWVEGKPLSLMVREQLCRGVPFPVPALLRIMIDVCEGLAYAHGRTDNFGRPLGIVHRDVSPPNILVTREGTAKISDFGIAAAQGRTTQTQPGIIRGKFSYMSPEQSKGEGFDFRSDIFAVGIVLFELITGRRLFLRETDTETIRAVRECRIPSIRAIRRDAPKSLVKATYRALAPAAKDRFASAAELGGELERILRKEHRRADPACVSGFLRELFPGEAPLPDRPEREEALGTARAAEAAEPLRAGGLKSRVFGHPYLVSLLLILLALAAAEFIAR